MAAVRQRVWEEMLLYQGRDRGHAHAALVEDGKGMHAAS